MADANFEAERMADLMRIANDELYRYGQLTQQTSDRINDAKMKELTGLNNFTKGTNTAAQAISAVAGAGVAASKAMYEGAKGATAFNSSLDLLSEATVRAGTALALLVPGGMLVKGLIAGVTAMTGAALAYTKAANEMSDKLYKGYSGLAESGAAAADGMTGVYNDAKKLGLSMNQLGSMVEQIAGSSKELAVFSGTVADGRKQFANIGAAMESSRAEMYKMGITQEQANAGLINYMRLQTKTGMQQRQTTEQMAESAKEYIYQTDTLAKLTGMNAKDQQSKREAALNEEQFQAKIRGMRRRGENAAADELETLNIMAEAMGETIGKGYRASINNNLKDEAARKLNFSAAGKQNEVIQKVTKGQMSAAQGAQLLGKALGRYADTTGEALGSIGAGENVGVKLSEASKAGVMATNGFVAMQKKIEEDRKKQRAGADALTGKYGELVKKQQDVNKKLEDSVFAGTITATDNMIRLADQTDSLANAFTTLTNGINKLLRIVGLGEKEDKVAGKEKEIREAQLAEGKARTAIETAKTPAELQQAKQDQKFYEDKVKLLRQERETAVMEDKNAKMDAEILKRSNDELKIAEAEKDEVYKTATAGQKLGFGKTDMQKAADKKFWEAVEKNRALSRNTGGARTEARGALESSGWKPPETSGAAGAPVGGKSVGQQDLAKAGLKIKQGDVQAEGKSVSPKLIEFAKMVQGNVEGFRHFSSFNDNFHNDKKPSSKHTQGLAFDFSVDKYPGKEAGAGLVQWLREKGASYAQDEYAKLSDGGKGGHFHVELPEFAEGGLLGAGKVGIAGEAGPEFITGPATVTPMNDLIGSFGSMISVLTTQNAMIDELIRVAKNGNDIQQKLLRATA